MTVLDDEGDLYGFHACCMYVMHFMKAYENGIHNVEEASDRNLEHRGQSYRFSAASGSPLRFVEWVLGPCRQVRMRRGYYCVKH